VGKSRELVVESPNDSEGEATSQIQLFRSDWKYFVAC